MELALAPNPSCGFELDKVKTLKFPEKFPETFTVEFLSRDFDLGLDLGRKLSVLSVLCSVGSECSLNLKLKSILLWVLG